MSDARLARIDAMYKEAIGSQVPGIAALVARKGKIVFFNAYGVADASGKVLKKDAIFRIASQKKAITATAAIMLWEEGKFKQLIGQSIDD